MKKKEATTLNYPAGDLLVGEKRQLDDHGRVIHYNGYICSYDEKGRLIQKSSQNRTTSYGYDAFDRLISVNIGNRRLNILMIFQGVDFLKL